MNTLPPAVATELLEFLKLTFKLDPSIALKIFSVPQSVSGLDPFGTRGNIRLQLANKIQELFGDLSATDRETMLDVRSRPTFTNFTYSITHFGSLAAFIIVPHVTAGIGIDLESTQRVTDRIVTRVCESVLEVAAAPSPAMLWTAKEAAFKALNHFCIRNKIPKQIPQLISEVEIMNWVSVSEVLWSFEYRALKNPLFGRGAAVESQNLSVSVAVSI